MQYNIAIFFIMNKVFEKKKMPGGVQRPTGNEKNSMVSLLTI